MKHPESLPLHRLTSQPRATLASRFKPSGGQVGGLGPQVPSPTRVTQFKPGDGGWVESVPDLSLCLSVRESGAVATVSEVQAHPTAGGSHHQYYGNNYNDPTLFRAA